MIKLPFISGQKFILSIGDDGTVLTFLDGSKVITKLFAASPAISDRREINNLLLKNPNVPIHVLLDSIEQTYSKQALPAVSALSIGKLVKRRLERDFTKTDITGAIPLGRDTEGRKDWLYMFVSTPTTPTISDWLEYFASLPNTFGGIYLLPIEMETIIHSINKALFKGDATKKKWQFLVTHNKTGGFRQTIVNNDKVVFTRLIRPGKDSLPDIVAGNIEQEIINTIDYLRRLGLSDDESINIFAIVSNELKISLETTKIRGKSLLLFTPFEVTKMLGFDSKENKGAKFADILLATNFANCRPVLKLANPKTKSYGTLLIGYNLTKVATIAIIPAITIYAAVMLFDIISLTGKIKDVEDKKAEIERRWKKVKNTDLYGIDDANKITDAMFLRRKVLREKRTPISTLEKLAGLRTEFIQLQSFLWNYEKNFSAEDSQGKVSSIINLDFSTKGSSLDDLFENYDSLSESINKNFSKFKIEVSKLPEKITFDSKTRNIPIQLKIFSKVETSDGTSGDEL